jgi:hypothetical protein
MRDHDDDVLDCRRELAWLASLERVFGNPDLRQELLWYRAMEKRDARRCRDLEVNVRVRALAAQVEDALPPGLTPRQRSAYYAVLFHQRLQAELAGWERVDCTCRSCADPRWGLN